MALRPRRRSGPAGEGAVPRLRSHLLRWLLIPLGALLMVGFYVTYQHSLEQVNEAFDRTLLGSALAMAEAVAVRHGTLTVDMPYAALEMLDNEAQVRIFYKVTCLAPAFLVTGHEDLPTPALPAGASAPVFVDIERQGEPLRMVLLQRPIYERDFPGPVLIQVAETLEARQALSRRLLVGQAGFQLLLLLAAALLIAHGVTRGLKPLKRLRQQVDARGDEDLTPIATAGVPREVAPLIEAINRHTGRLALLHEAQRQFVADASHQLKTPLTVLKTQAALALQQQAPEDVRRIVREMHDSTDATARVIQQLLALARSDAAAPVPRESLELTALARDATFELLPQALARSIDLGFEAGEGDVRVPGIGLLLREAVSNLVDNALRYTPAGGRVTVRVAPAVEGMARLEVVDDGPGIAPEHRERVFERFFRVPGQAAEGCGLGLAIVRQIVVQHGGQIELGEGEGGRGGGLAVRILLPAERPAR